VILICASSDGNNLKLAHRLGEIAAEMDLDAQVLDLVAEELPMFTNAAKKLGAPVGFEPLFKRFQDADGFLICAPEYNGLTPPVLANTMAWLSTKGDDFRVLFSEKPVGLATHSGGGGGKVMIAMRMQMAHLGANVVGRELVTSYSKPLNEDSAKAVLRQLAG
jgi:NAD(P)H-dependent FMN reductase